MATITLTPEQEALMETYYDKWLKISKNCDGYDEEKIIHYAKMVYEAIDKPFPKDVYFCDNPIEAARLCAKLQGHDPNSPDFNSHVFEELNSQLYGYQEAGWLAFYDFADEVLKLPEAAKMRGMIGLAHCCGWWTPYEEAVVFQKKAKAIFTDEENRLHNESGPALEYHDGTKIWCIHGLDVTEQIIMAPETLTVQQINGTNNVEVRTIMIQRFGWPRYLTESGAELLNYRHNDVENSKEALYNTSNYGKRLVVTCPTGRMFSLGVPDSVQTCEEAQEWLGRGKFNVIART